MRLMPRSLAGRLLATAAIALVAALMFAAFAIGHVLERFVTHGLDERLDAQIAVLSRTVQPDGHLDPARAPPIPPFDVSGSGWTWEVIAPSATLRSLPGVEIAPDPGPLFLPPPRRDRPQPFEVRVGGRSWSHGRMLTIPTAGGDVRILVAGPRELVERPLRAAIAPLLLSLLLLGAALAAAILIQLRFGLRPLATVGTMLGEVRAGTRRHVDATEPAELLPLIAELNALIDANARALEQARGHVANLAHGLKTPLAALRLDLTTGGRDPDGRLTRHVDRIDRHVRHHLGRARAASPGGAGRIATVLGPRVVDLVDALAHIHADQPVRAMVTVPEELKVRCDPQDIDEMLGNLLDNGWRWATSTLVIAAEQAGGQVRITVFDDGPGIAAEALDRALEPGARLDERGDGHGFGLSITRELVELYGGALTLANAAPGGLVATITLPGS